MEKRIGFLVNIFFYGTVTAAVILVIRFGVPLFWPFLGGLALAYLFKQVSRRFRIRGGAPVAVIAVIFYALVVLVFWAAAVLIADSFIDLTRLIPSFLTESVIPAAENLGDKALSFIETLAPQVALSLSEIFDLVTGAFSELISSLSASLLSFATSAAKSFPMFLIGFVFMIVSSFYICMDYTRITRFIMRQIPSRAQPVILDVKNFLSSCLFKVVKAYVIIMFVTFVELSIGFFFLGVDNAVRFAAITAILDILPVIGSGAVLLPWGIYHLAAGTPGTGIGLIVLSAIITVVRNIIEPRIVGDQLGLHPVITLTAMFLGLKTLGVSGVFIAPMAVLLIRYLTTVEGIKLYKTE